MALKRCTSENRVRSIPKKYVFNIHFSYSVSCQSKRYVIFTPCMSDRQRFETLYKKNTILIEIGVRFVHFSD